MRAQDNEINRDIDTATGHIRVPGVERAETADDARTGNVIRHPDALDDEAEGHLRRGVEDGEDPALRWS